MKKSDYLKTAQFARMCNVSKQTLIYYHKMGIFYPEYIDEKGYRFYSISQHGTFVVIAMLRKLNTPLSEIKDYLKNKDASSFIDLLEKKELEVKGKISELEKLLDVIDERKSIAKIGMTIKDYDKVQFIVLPEERIIISEYLKDQSESEVILTISDFQNNYYGNDECTFIGGVVDKKELIGDDKDFNLTYFYSIDKNNSDRAIIKPEGLYAMIYHKGAYAPLDKSYKKLISYIDDNNYRIIGNAYEEVILDDCTQKEENDFLMRISILVEVK